MNVGVLVVSSKILGGEPDSCRKILEECLTKHQMSLVSYEIAADDRQEVTTRLRQICHEIAPAVLFTLGGTGVRPTDWVPEATRDVVQKEIPGVGEAMRAESLKKVRTAMLSRGTAGIKETTLIINLPGSPKGMKENFEFVAPLLEHIVEKIS